MTVVDEVPVGPEARIYTEGWQSWSPTTWYAAGADGLAPQHGWQQTMHFRPGTPVAPSGLQAEGVLVVDPADGSPTHWYGARSLTDVPTLRATLADRVVTVSADGPVASGTAGSGSDALAAVGETVAELAAVAVRQAPTVWCSWYRYFEAVTAADVAENLVALAEHDLPADVVQIDDGWTDGLSLVAARRFGDLPGLVGRVRDAGRRVGLWVAPFIVGVDTDLARVHPDWLVGDAGRNWDTDLRGLDLTHPGVRDHLSTELSRLVGLGVDYLKLDFLYAGAVPGERQTGVTPVEAYRSGLALIRETVGPEVYLVGCGAPLLPSIGLVDAMRTSSDVFHRGDEDGTRALRGLMAMAARTWQHGRWWSTDPDCLVARPAYPQRQRWADAVRTYGGLRSVSDRVAELDAWGLATTRDLLADVVPPTPLPEPTVEAGAQLAESLVGQHRWLGDPP